MSACRPAACLGEGNSSCDKQVAAARPVLLPCRKAPSGLEPWLFRLHSSQAKAWAHILGGFRFI